MDTSPAGTAPGTAASPPDARERHDTTPDGNAADLTPEPSAKTVARCRDCGSAIIRGGPIVPTPEAIQHAAGASCAAGDGWAWCGTARRYSLWL